MIEPPNFSKDLTHLADRGISQGAILQSRNGIFPESDFLLQVAAADPSSKAGQMAKEFVDKREAAYAETMKKFNLTPADMQKRRDAKAAGVK